ncbi:MAG: hypothetical protein H0W77_01515 [Acidobacteria bacterium]|nr:hypothetical protein [Acidobacteriota bacterium]
MKNLFWLILLISLYASAAFAQCEKEPTIERTGKIIHAKKFSVPFKTNFASKMLFKMIGALTEGRENEMFLSFDASVTGADWMVKNAEAAVLTVFVDGKYNQDVILFAGAKKFNYRASLGKFETGEHTLSIALNEARSAPNAKQVKLFSSSIFPSELTLVKNGGDERDFIALTHAPVIYARPDTVDKFSDIPLLTYYEIFPFGENAFKIRYTVIYSNEDGGTQTAALMARWGRATDIEWVYEIEFKDGNLVSEIYQGANHETKKFAGKRIFGNHSLIFDVTVNNNFSDAGCSELRSAQLPIKVDLSRKSRETIMDENEWTYRLMAQEATREGRINAAKLDANTIADPRDYLYAEIYSEPKAAAIALEAESFSGEKFSSDLGNAALRVSRNGFVRIAMRFPKDSMANFPAAVTVACYAASNDGSTRDGSCQNLRLIKLVRLDQNYLPVVQKLDSPPQTVKVGEKAVFPFSQRRQAILR